MKHGSTKRTNQPTDSPLAVKANVGLNLKLTRMQELDLEFERQAKRLRHLSRRLKRKLTGAA